MSELGKPRRVRCFKCGSFLPELTGSPFYQCSACGAVLSADRGNAVMDPLFGNSDEERVPRFSGRVYENSEMSRMTIGLDAEDDVRSNGSSSSRSERRRFVSNTFDNPRAGTRIDDYTSGTSRGRKDRGFEETRSRIGSMNGIQRSGKHWDRRFADIDEMDGYSRPSRNDDYQRRGGNVYGEPLSRRNDMEDKAEILRKLEELKVQVIRSGDVIDKAKDKMRFSPDPYGYPDEFSSDGYSAMNRRHFDSRPSHVNHYNDPSPYMNRHGFQSFPGGPHRGPYDSSAPNVSHHHPSCSCLQCHNQYRVQGFTNEPHFHPHGYQNSGLGSLNRREMYDRDRATSFQSSNQPSHQRFPSDVTSEASGFVRNNRPERILGTRGTRLCQPVAGGAPFVACHNCHKPLKLPKKMILVVNGNPKQMRCGACSVVIELTIDSKSLNATVSSDANGTSNISRGDFNASNPNKGGESFTSDDFDDSSVDSQSQGRRKEHPPPAGAPLQEHFDYSRNYHVPKQSENGAKMDKTTLEQNSIHDGSATEMEMTSNEYGISTGTTLGSGEPTREGEDSSARKTADAFFARMMNDRFNGSNRAADDGYDNEEERFNVTINGNLVSNRLVKKAEKLAGPIRPGHYWYDFRAGFWGVIGGPCLGIIPPFIEEFNYPMPDNCAGGSTGVSVNGRELHPKDLKLLASRGLPSDRDRSHLILEISGRVLDANTGEELQSLGKLAPTIERFKRGFGMKDPSAAA